MDFKTAYSKMLEGKKIRREGWVGYWYINKVTGKLTIFTAEGKTLTQSDDITITVMNTLAEDWEVVDDSFENWLLSNLRNEYFLPHQTFQIVHLASN
jgi:hypothetical protein